MVFIEDDKWQKTCSHSTKHTQANRNNLLCKCHFCKTSFCVSGLRSNVNSPTTNTIVGTMKESGPKIIRHRTDIVCPTREEVCSFSFNHCSKKITTNIAVITKLIPEVLIFRRDPMIPPVVAAADQ